MKSYLLLSLLCLLQSCGSRLAKSASTSALANNETSPGQVSAVVPSFTVHLKITSTSSSRDVYDAEVWSSQNSDKSQLVYAEIPCFGSDYETATCQTRTVNITASHSGQYPSTMMIVLPSRAKYSVQLSCMLTKGGISCTSTSVEIL